MSETERLLKVSAVAKRCGVCVETVRNWIAWGWIVSARKVGGQWRIPESALAALGAEVEVVQWPLTTAQEGERVHEEAVAELRRRGLA